MSFRRASSIRCASLAALAVSTACGGASDADGTRTVRTVVGDTTIVRTIGPGAWGDSVALVEEVRIGVLEGSEEYQFGQIVDLAVDPEGGIYVFDSQVPALRYYAAGGSYVRTVGGEGQGPGEYLDASLGIVIRRSDGRVVMRDPRNMRLNVYEPDGTPSDSWRVDSGLFTSRATLRDTADQLYLKILTGPPEPNAPWPVALQHLDPQGRVVDTLAPPVLPDEPTGPGGTFAPSKAWDFSPLGGFVVGVTDTYRIEHHRPDGSVLRIERDADPVPIHPEEKAEHEARNAWIEETQGRFMTSELPPVPDVKPVFSRLIVGEEGRIWVRRYTEAARDRTVEVPDEPDPDVPPPVTWRAPAVYDVFEPDGAFLGSVTLPPRTSPWVIRGDRVWGVQLGELDEATVVGYRIVPGGPSPP
ncbi:MAG: 6-bladed beta-propeller [Gemmatimonadota bacterium]|jgi:hypothetical protein